MAVAWEESIPSVTCFLVCAGAPPRFFPPGPGPFSRGFGLARDVRNARNACKPRPELLGDYCGGSARLSFRPFAPANTLAYLADVAQSWSGFWHLWWGFNRLADEAAVDLTALAQGAPWANGSVVVVCPELPQSSVLIQSRLPCASDPGRLPIRPYAGRVECRKYH